MKKSVLEKEHQKQFCHRQNGAKLFCIICKRAPNFFWEFAERLSTFFGNLQNGSQLFFGICRTALNIFQEFSKRLSTFFYNFHNGAQRKIVSLQEGAAPYCKKFTSLWRDSPYRSTPSGSQTPLAGPQTPLAGPQTKYFTFEFFGVQGCKIRCKVAQNSNQPNSNERTTERLRKTKKEKRKE